MNDLTEKYMFVVIDLSYGDFENVLVSSDLNKVIEKCDEIGNDVTVEIWDMQSGKKIEDNNGNVLNWEEHLTGLIETK